jgi:sulfatase modifying factor 1
MMSETQRKVMIKLTNVGSRQNKVVAVLSKIQGLKDTPEKLIANAPCYISGIIPLSIAEQVKNYLEKAGAAVELEAAEMPENILSSSSWSDEFPDDHSSLRETQRVEAFYEEEPSFEPTPQKRRPQQEMRSPFTFTAAGLSLILVIIMGGIMWLYFSGRVSHLTHQYEGRPVVGQLGILEIENIADAKLTLHHVLGTRVFEQIPLEGTTAYFRQGDYYVEARNNSQILLFPVYIEGRGHRVKVTVSAFPDLKMIPRNMAYIPEGWFRMGNKETDVAHFGFPDEKPDIDVYVGAFLMSKYEVTNREYAQFVKEGGYENELYWESLIKDWDSLTIQVPAYGRMFGNDGWNSVSKYIRTSFINTDSLPGPRLWENDTPPYEYGQDEYPVIAITLYEAEAYCKWLSQQSGKVYRLPTEAEWEKAARGYEGYFFSYGNEYDPTRANTETQGPKKVGSYPPNGFGVYDLTGNVWEWIADQYQADAYQRLRDQYKNEIRNPRVFDETNRYNRRIVRGGSFRSVNRINAKTTIRYPMFPNYWHTNIGLRYVTMP